MRLVDVDNQLNADAYDHPPIAYNYPPIGRWHCAETSADFVIFAFTSLVAF
jgi:hypothetical protein